MKILEKLIGDSTYMVTDHEANRFNFCGLLYIDNQLVEAAKAGIEFDLKQQSLLPEDVKLAIETMITNDVIIEDFTGIVRYENDDITYYVLVWEQ